MTARLTFEHELMLLRDNLTEMGHLIENAIDKTFEGF